MKKLFLFFLFITNSIYSQCLLSDLTLSMLGKEYFELNNFLLSNPNVSNIRENMSIGDKKIPDYKTSYNYLKGDNYQKFISFDFLFNKCFTNDTKSDVVRYDIRLINNKVYKIEIKKDYNLRIDESIIDDDFTRLAKFLKKTYPVFNGSNKINKKFNITPSNPNGEYLETATEFSFGRLKSNAKIWKVDEVKIAIGYDYSISKYGGYTFPETNSYIEISFINLKNTPLDNRGY